MRHPVKQFYFYIFRHFVHMQWRHDIWFALWYYPPSSRPDRCSVCTIYNVYIIMYEFWHSSKCLFGLRAHIWNTSIYRLYYLFLVLRHLVNRTVKRFLLFRLLLFNFELLALFFLVCHRCARCAIRILLLLLLLLFTFGIPFRDRIAF